ncbi:MAG: enoyl-CoA hydratase-related protein [Gammaproteobacteria bacterium]|jgi:enoyl-CoA hydratase/carnithine racemase|nr:enoyl-CoA hydratase-related protein [Gammaproteobacteria bacterium]
MSRLVRLEQDGFVARLIIARPPHNFFNVEMITDMADLLEECDRNPSVRVTILTSDLKNFCAGADFGDAERPEPVHLYTAANRLIRRRKPMIAAIGGAAVGGGLGVALTADLRVGDETAWFQANFTRIGLSAGFGISHTLPAVVGRQRARDLLVTARRVTADEAFAIHLLDRIAPPGELQATALAVAQEIAANSPVATAASRELIGREEADLFAAAISRELEYQRPLLASSDFAEGVRAAAERREPNFSTFPEEKE